MLNLGISQVVPVLPYYATESGLTASHLGIVLAMPSASRLLVNLPLGRLADTVGRKPLMVAGTMLTAVGILGTGYAMPYGLVALIPFRLLVGIGSASSMVGSGAMVADLSDDAPEQRARIMGVQQAVISCAWAGGPAVGGWVAETYGPLTSFGAAGVGTLLCSAGYAFLPETVSGGKRVHGSDEARARARAKAAAGAAGHAASGRAADSQGVDSHGADSQGAERQRRDPQTADGSSPRHLHAGHAHTAETRAAATLQPTSGAAEGGTTREQGGAHAQRSDGGAGVDGGSSVPEGSVSHSTSGGGSSSSSTSSSSSSSSSQGSSGSSRLREAADGMERSARTWRAILQCPDQRLLVAISAASAISQASFMAVVPLHLAQWGAGPASLGSVFAVVSAVYMLSMPIGSALADWSSDKRRLAVGGMLVSQLAYGALAGAHSYDAFVLVLVASSFGSGLAGPAVGALMAEITPSAIRGQALSVHRTAADLFGLVSPIALGLIADVYSCPLALLASAGSMSAMVAITGVDSLSAARRAAKVPGS
jgi:MFS family permease